MHSSRAQRTSQTDDINQNGSTATNMANPPALQSVAPTVRIRKDIRDVAAPARQSSSSIPVATAIPISDKGKVVAARLPAWVEKDQSGLDEK
jgi:hypothetical protein